MEFYLIKDLLTVWEKVSKEKDSSLYGLDYLLIFSELDLIPLFVYYLTIFSTPLIKTSKLKTDSIDYLFINYL